MALLKIKNVYKILNLKPSNFYNGEYSLTVIQYFGFWRPSTYSSQWKKLLYSIYSILMSTSFSFFVCSLLGIFFQVCQLRSHIKSKILQKCSNICRYVTKVKKWNTLLLSQHTMVLIFLLHLFFIFVG